MDGATNKVVSLCCVPTLSGGIFHTSCLHFLINIPKHILSMVALAGRNGPQSADARVRVPWQRNAYTTRGMPVLGQVWVHGNTQQTNSTPQGRCAAQTGECECKVQGLGLGVWQGSSRR